uniref:Tryptophan synthase beta chain-like PALP domain-containing protein n=1 Tax=Populus trichocarpa TaxID=3694 RepID=A0A3N7GDD7_POPTR
MKLQGLSSIRTIKAMKTGLCSAQFSSHSQGLPKVKLSDEELMSKVLNRRWMLHIPDTEIHQIKLSLSQGRNRDGPSGNLSFLNNTKPYFGDDLMEKGSEDPFFYVVRDDLLHPLVNGNKARKLDALLPLLVDYSVTDVVTCGGCQSAHAAAVGVIRLVQYLCQSHLLGKERQIKLVVDAGTGTTAIGLGIGAQCLGLPWEVTAVMLADTIDAYRQQEQKLISDFRTRFGFHLTDHCLNEVDGVVHWVARCHQRKFGNVLEGETETCQQIAQQTGILVDPVYTLAAWEMATQLSRKEMEGGARVVMLHTGGTLGLFGLAQRYKSYFRKLKEGLSSVKVALH